MSIQDKVEQRLVNIELQRAKMVRSIRARIESGVVPTRERRLASKRNFGILRAEQKRLEQWLASRKETRS